MLSLQKLLLFLCLVFVTHSAPPTEVDVPSCGLGEYLSSLITCSSFVYETRAIVRHYIDKETPYPMEVGKKVMEMCEKATSCLSTYHCKGVQEKQENIEKMCWHFAELSIDTEPCLKKFFLKAYLAQSSDESSCLRNYAFVENNLAKKHDAYTNGKSCFLDFVESNCDENAMYYFSKYYKIFADAISIKPEGNGCVNKHHFLNGIQCQALVLETDRTDHEIEQNEVLRYDPVITANYLKMYKDANECMHRHRSCSQGND